MFYPLIIDCTTTLSSNKFAELNYLNLTQNMLSSNPEVLQTLNQAFSLCCEVDAQKRNMGEKELQTRSLMDRNYPLQCLEFMVVQNTSIPPQNRWRAAVEFKRWVNDEWV